MSTAGGALGWGLVAGSSFVAGTTLAIRTRVEPVALGWIMALGTGALFGAVAYELVDEAGRLAGGTGWVGAGLVVGGTIFILSVRPPALDGDPASDDERGFGLPDLATPVMAIVPESIVIVGSLLAGHGVSLAVIVAVYACGVPESIWWTERQRRRGTPARTILTVAVLMMLLAGATTGIVHQLLLDAAPQAVAFTLAAAGGAVLANLANDLIPEARAHAGHRSGIAVLIGFALVFGLVEVAH